jgi:hypothetical protein
MTYRSDRQITQELLPVHLFATVIREGIDDPNGEDARQLMAWLSDAQEAVLDGVAPAKGTSLARRARRAVELVKKPFVQAEAPVAKFGLTVFYLLDCLRRNGVFGLVDGTPLDKTADALLSPDGTLTEFANIEKVDESAQKQARKMLETLQGDGYFRGIAWE